MLGPNNEPLSSLFPLFPKNMEITNLRKVGYLSQNLLKARFERISKEPRLSQI